MISKKIGFIGLGEIGKPMAISVLKQGFDLTVLGHIRPEPVEELRGLGAKVALSPAELAQTSDFIITIVRDTSQTEQVIFGEQGLCEGIKPGTILIVMSTHEYQFILDLPHRMEAKGVSVLDAPVSGGTRGAEQGALTIMVGGEEKTFEECRPLFEAMGKNIFYIGSIGSGMIAKLVNNLIMAVSLSGVKEALSLGAKAGIDPKVLLEVVKVSTGRSQVAENYWNRYEPRIKNGSLLVGKDLKAGLELASQIGVELPVVSLISHLDFGRLARQE
ncbi:NAD(P)-dependent oxidoreductase [Chloroflexota bacterium]